VLKSLAVLDDGSLVHRNQSLIVREICGNDGVLGYLRRLDDITVLRAFKNLVDSPSDSALPARDNSLTLEAQVFAELIELLSLCAPNRLVYRKGVAARESEEAALIIQAAIPITGAVSALLSVNNYSMKAVLLRFLEQVWGTVPLSITPAVNVTDLTPVGRLTSKPATAMSPIVIHLLEVR
jgi:hypothetical protein